MAKLRLGGKRGGGYNPLTSGEFNVAMVQSSRMWGDNIEKQEGYVMTGASFQLNRKLRELENDVDPTKTDLGITESWTGKFNANKVVQNMDELTSQPIIGGKNMLLTRFVDENWAQNALGIDDIRDLVHVDLKGVKYKEKSYTSGSAVPKQNVFQDKPIKIEIETPRGSRGFVARNTSESEVVLPRNSSFRINKVHYDGKYYVVRVRATNTPDNSGRGFAEGSARIG